MDRPSFAPYPEPADPLEVERALMREESIPTPEHVLERVQKLLASALAEEWFEVAQPPRLSRCPAPVPPRCDTLGGRLSVTAAGGV